MMGCGVWLEHQAEKFGRCINLYKSQGMRLGVMNRYSILMS